MTSRTSLQRVVRTAPQPLRILTLLGLLIPVLAVILACGTSAATTSSGGSSGGTSSAPKQQQAAKVGDTITINGEGTTLVSVKQIQPGQYDQPAGDGKSYYVLHLKITNSGSSPVDFNGYDYKLLTGQGSTVNDTIISSEPSDKMLSSGQIAPGGSAEGDLVYALSTSDHGAKLVWQPGLDNSLDHVWNLGL